MDSILKFNRFTIPVFDGHPKVWVYPPIARPADTFFIPQRNWQIPRWVNGHVLRTAWPGHALATPETALFASASASHLGLPGYPGRVALVSDTNPASGGNVLRRDVHPEFLGSTGVPCALFGSARRSTTFVGVQALG